MPSCILECHQRCVFFPTGYPLVPHLAFADFCFWAPPSGPTDIGDSEADEVAYCSQPGRGTRIIPDGTVTGIQWLNAPSYVQMMVFLDQTKVNLQGNDSGGELDPFGADLVRLVEG